MSKSIKVNVVMNLILSLSSMIFPLVSVPYVSRVLSVESNGTVAFAQSVTGLVSIFCTLGVQTYGIRACARVRDNRRELSIVVRELLIILSVCTTLTYIIFAILVFTIPKFYENRSLMIVFGIGILLTTFGSEWFFQATEQYFYITVRSIIFKIIALIGLFFLVREDSDYVLYGAFIVFAASASNLLNIFRLIRSIDWSFSVKLKPLRHMKPILIFFGNTFANNLYLTLDTVLLGFLSPSTFQLGLYQLVVRLKNVILSGVGSISNAVLPRLSYQAREHRELFNRLLRKSSSFTIILSSTISIYIFIMANDIILLLSGTRFVGAVPSLQVMSIVILFVAISGITGYQILTPLGKEKIMTISTLLGGVLDLVLNVLLDANFGAFGASLSLLATEGLISLIQVIACRKYILSILERNQVLAILMNIIISTCLLAFLHRFILSFSPLINLVISGICLLLSESIVLYVLKEQLTSNIIHQVLNRSLYNKNEHGLR